MASTITMAEVTELTDPQVRKVAMRVVKEVELAIEKTVAHKAEPANFPMPQQPDSVERIIQSRFQRLKPEQQQLAVARIMPRVKAAKAKREKAFGDLHNVNLGAATPVAEQVSKLPFPQALKLSTPALQNITDIHGQIVRVNPGGLVPQQTTNKLELRLHRVRCVDETGSGLFGEVGKDEIALWGTTVDESGDTKKVPEFAVGSFNDGDVKTFSPPRRFTMFSLSEGTAFPKSYFVTLVLAEKDLSGGLADFLNRLLEKVRERVIAALSAALGAAIGASGGPVGALIGAAVGFVVGKVFDLLKSLFADDIFPPRTISVAIPSLTHRFTGGKTDSPEAIARFVGHDGTYDVTYDWRVFA